jgi:hypothetical protein
MARVSPRKISSGPSGPHQKRPMGRAGRDFRWTARPNVFFIFLRQYLWMSLAIEVMTG